MMCAYVYISVWMNVWNLTYQLFYWKMSHAPDCLYNIEMCSSFALLWLHPCHCLSTDFFNKSWQDIKAQWYWHKIMEKWKQNYCNANQGWYFKNVMRVYRVLIFVVSYWWLYFNMDQSECFIKQWYPLCYQSNVYTFL